MRRAPLVALCAALSIALLVAIVENFGLGSKTLVSFWDCLFTPGPVSYTLRASGGRLIGTIACGAREGAESYAPDEIDALMEFASGIATMKLSKNSVRFDWRSNAARSARSRARCRVVPRRRPSPYRRA